MTREQVRTLLVTIGILGLVYPVWYAYAVLLPHIGRDLGWGRATVSAALAVLIVTHALTGPLAGRLADRFGTRPVLRVGATVLGLGLLAASRISSPWHLYLTYGLLGGLGIALSGWVPSVTALARRFEQRVSTTTGIASTGIGVGLMVSAPVLQWAVLRWGWRAALAVEAVILFVLLQLAASLLPGGRANRPPAHHAELDAARLTLRSVLGRRQFWLVFVAFFGFSFGVQFLQAHQVAYLLDSGWPALVAASVVAFVGLASLPLKPFLGVVADRFGREATYTVGVTSLIIAIALLVVQGSHPGPRAALYPYALTLAISYSMVAPVYPAVVADLFGGPHYGWVLGALGAGSGLGSALGVYGGGLIFDSTGSYTGGFFLAAALAGIALLAIWSAAPRKGTAYAHVPQRLTTPSGGDT